jgi:hypothetical protein
LTRFALALLSGCLLFPAQARAQTARAVFAASPPKIDGLLDDPAWQKAPVHGAFQERRPALGAVPADDTTFQVVFDDKAIYFGIRCRDSRPDQIRARTVQRDNFALFSDDAISVKIDPQRDRRTTIGFALNPASGQLDYRGINESEFLVEFDPIWQGEARRTPDGWSAELRIPYTSLQIDPRRPPERIGLNLSRDHSRRNATYDWALMRPPLGPIAASRYGELVGLADLPRLAQAAQGPGQGQARPGRSVSLALIPYLLSGFSHDPDPHLTLSGGADARLQVGDRLSLQLSLNTDFAQVDLDDQRINLGRFGLFFPEKRDFFLRDLEIFTFGQAEEAQALQTRRIGLHEGTPVPILDAVKLVARPLPWLRLGVLQAVTLPVTVQGRDQPYTLALVGRAMAELRGSYVGLMLTHRQSLTTREDHNVVLGVDGAWRSSGPFLATGFAMLSLTGAQAGPVAVAAGGQGHEPGQGGRPAPGAGAELTYRGLLVRPSIRYAYYDPALRADLGFLRRVGVHQGEAALTVEPRIQRRGVERLTFSAEGGVVASSQRFLDASAEGSARLSWSNGFAVAVGAGWSYETIADAFSVGPGVQIPAGSYNMKGFGVHGETPAVWAVSGSLSVYHDDYYGGTQGGIVARLTARPSSLLRLEAGADLTRSDFPDERGVLYTAALNGRVGLGFSPRLGLDAFAAWNNVADLVRVQGRLRFRYADGSDIFVVYQHDLTQAGQERFRSLMVKLTYQWQS